MFYRFFKNSIPFFAGFCICLLAFAVGLAGKGKDPVRIEIEGIDQTETGLIKFYRTRVFSKRKIISPDKNVWQTNKTVLSLILVAPYELLPKIEKVNISVAGKKLILSNTDISGSPDLKTSETLFVLPIPIDNFNYEKHLRLFLLSFSIFVFVSFVVHRTVLNLRHSRRIFIMTGASVIFCMFSALLVLRGSLLSGAFSASTFFFMISVLINLPSSSMPSSYKFSVIRTISENRLISLFVFLSFALCLRGIGWGIAEPWNPDQMAFGFDVKNFDRPHLTNFIHLFLSRLPVLAADVVFNLSSYHDINRIALLISRSIHLFMFLGCGLFIYVWAKRIAGVFPAALASGLFCMSPGYGAFSKFLTSDTPLMFFMFLAFHFSIRIAENPSARNYLIAGLFVGIAASAKHYGLAVGASMAAAHFIYCHEDKVSLKNAILNRNFALALCWVPLGFFLGDPLALINFKKFILDFYTNYTFVPVYNGYTEGHSFGKILFHSFELFSPPVAAIVFLSNILTFYYLVQRKFSGSIFIFLIASWTVFTVYFLKFGFFPRSEVRFSLPFFAFLVPSCVILFSALGRKTVIALAIPFLIYNSACLWIVGDRFSNDPRIEAVSWFKDQCREGCVIESSPYSPDWNKILGPLYQSLPLPQFKSNITVLLPFFEGKNFIADKLEKTVREDKQKIVFYKKSNLVSRNPEFIAINSLAFNQYVTSSRSEMYLQVAHYYRGLLEGRFNYHIVFDGKTPEFPWWAYPKHIDFLENRMVILKRK